MLSKLNASIFFTILLAILLFFISLYTNIKYEKELLSRQISILNDSVRNEYKKRLKESVNQTIIFIDTTYKSKLQSQKNKHVLNKQNKQLFYKDLRAYLYSNTIDKARYTWINKIVNFKGGNNYAIRLIHPNLKETEGIPLSTNTKDIKGNLPYLEELKGIKKSGEIFFTYFFIQLDTKNITEKLSYAKLYKELNLIVATGIPINTLNNLITQEKIKIESSYNKHLQTIIIIRVFVLVIFISLLILLRKRLVNALKENLQLNKKLEKKLDNIETKFDKFFELPINILLVANFDNKILQTNIGWQKILDYKEEDLINKSLLDFVHKNDLTSTLNHFKTLENEESTLYFENRIKHKNNSYKTLAWSITSIPEKKLFYAVAQDITELKEKSNLIFQQSKMAAIGEMTANIAHQWRQPLSIISTASSGIMIKKETNTLDDKFLIDTMNQITNSTQYLSETIEDFRNFYKPNKQRSVFNIGSIINKTINLVKSRFQSNNIELIVDIEDIKIDSFENELLQVIINILNNAHDQLIKTNVDKKMIFINAYKKDKKMHLEIIDSALGIDKQILNRIFEPYFTTKDKSMGTGIGLYMSEEIVSKHLKGEILVLNHTYIYNEKTYTGAKFIIILDL